MSLRDEALAATSAVGPECGIPKLLRTLDEPFRSELAEVIADPSVQAKALSRALWDKYQVRLSYYTINRHRRPECQCPR